MLLDHPDRRVPVDVAHDDDGHEIRPVPVAIEPQQLLPLRALDGFRLANRRPVRVSRPLKLDAPNPVAGALVGAQVHPPFREHDAALAIDTALIERRRPRPVLEHEQCAVEHAGNVRRHPQRVLSVVEARRRVCIRTDTQAERGQEVDDALPGEMTRPLELHVLDEMRQPLLVVVFQHGTSLDDEAQLGAVGRLRVCAHVVAQAVRQGPDRDSGIDRHLLRQAVGGDGGGRGFLPGGGCLSGCVRPHRQKQAANNTGPENPKAQEGHVSIVSTCGMDRDVGLGSRVLGVIRF